MENTLAREFLERRVVTRAIIPISFGMDGHRPEAKVTMGEASPQVYESRVSSETVAWSLHFRAHRFVAAAQFGARVKGNVSEVARATIAGQANPLSLNFLMVRVPVADFSRFRISPAGFGVFDYIGRNPTLIERWMALVFGR